VTIGGPRGLVSSLGSAMQSEGEAHRPDVAGTSGAAASSAGSPDEILEEIDNPVERLKLLSGDDEEMARYLDALDVKGPREREMLYEISRTRPLARPERFPTDHRNMVEALESLARHGYHGARVGGRLGPLRVVVKKAVELIARYVVVSYIRNTSTTMRNLYGLREIESEPFSREHRELRRARMDAERMVDALIKSREIGVPTFLIGGLAIPLVATLGRVTGVLGDVRWAGVIAVVSLLVALGTSWLILRGSALASRRIRLSTQAPARVLWDSVGWCGKPPKDDARTFVIVAVSLTLAAWIIVPVLVGLAYAL
jgi:hypothetical protein